MDALACLTFELGFGRIPITDAERVLQTHLPPVPLILNGAVPEDPRIAALKAGIPINRADWDLSLFIRRAKRVSQAKEKK